MRSMLAHWQKVSRRYCWQRIHQRIAKDRRRYSALSISSTKSTSDSSKDKSESIIRASVEPIEKVITIQTIFTRKQRQR